MWGFLCSSDLVGVRILKFVGVEISRCSDFFGKAISFVKRFLWCSDFCDVAISFV